MQKAWRNSIVITPVFLILAIFLMASGVIRTEKVLLEASDGLSVRADEYITDSQNPYILLLHEQGSSRGEFQTIARKLCKMDYNCLAVDLRNGGNDHRVSNETAKACREKRCPTGASDVELDILTAINYAVEKSTLPVILFGSSANASLSLKLARENNSIRAVAAFSPGEYFLPEISIRDTIADMKKPTFITSSLAESTYVAEIVSGMSEDYLTIFTPEMGEGERGVASLNSGNKNNSEYWLALLLFFKDLR